MIHVKLTEVTVSVLPETDYNYHAYAVKVVYRGNDRYAVVNSQDCLCADGTWVSALHDAVASDECGSRFDYDTAHEMAIDIAPTVEVNGMTAAEIAAGYES